MKHFSIFKRIGLTILVCLFQLNVWAQVKQISGTVSDEKGEPLIGVNVSVKGGTNGAITDLEGKFSLNVEGKDVVVFSYIGYITQEIRADDPKIVKVALIEDSETLDEVVVVGYGVMKKSDVTGSISSLKSKDLTSVPTSNVLEAMQGKIAGLDMTKSDGEAGSAIVMLHDHGAHFSIGKEKMVKPFEVSEEVMNDANKWSVGCYDGQYTGDYFAANGYVVLAIDALFWNERGRKEGVNYDGQQALASNLLQMGMNWCGVITYDDIRSVDFLASLPQVNKECIGSLGFSMGAHRSWMLSAMTDKIKAGAAICWMNTTEYLMTLTNNQNRGGSSYSMLIPGIRNFMDYPHVASIACPKPMLFFNGAYDKLFPIKGTEDAFGIMRNVWESQQAADKLVTKIWDSPHFFSKEMQIETLKFFNKYLK